MARHGRARAMVIEAYAEPLVRRDIDIPPLSDGQVLVRILASGVCGSDVHMWRGRDARTTLPMIPGHEGVGEVAEVCGEKRSLSGRMLRPGDRIIWDRGVTCGHCYYCAVLKQPALCPDRWTYGIHKPSSEFPYLNGCYSDHIILRRETHVVHLDEYPTVDPAVLVAAACSGGTTAHAFDIARPAVGDTVVIQGPGPLGAFGVDFAVAAGARNVVVVGGTESRLDVCRALGATHVLNRRETSAEERVRAVRDLTSGRGADFVYETAGTADCVTEGLEMLRPGGVYVSAGFAVPTEDVRIDWFRCVGRRSATIRGVWVSDPRHLLAAVARVTGNPDKYARLVTHKFGLEEATRALVVVENREATKAVLLTSGGRSELEGSEGTA